MVPSRVVRGGLLGSSTDVSILPFGFMGLLLQVIVSEKKKRQLFNDKPKTIIPVKLTIFVFNTSSLWYLYWDFSCKLWRQIWWKGLLSLMLT